MFNAFEALSEKETLSKYLSDLFRGKWKIKSRTKHRLFLYSHFISLSALEKNMHDKALNDYGCNGIYFTIVRFPFDFPATKRWK